MVKRCVYCNSDISEDSVVDICKPCMHQVWGPKMSEAIIGGMQREKDKGNLELGNVSNSFKKQEGTKKENNIQEISKMEIKEEKISKGVEKNTQLQNTEELMQVPEIKQDNSEIERIQELENIENIDNLLN